MKKLVILLLAPSIVFAHNVSNNIDILPLSSMNFPKELQSEIKTYNSDVKNKGYVEKDNPYIRQLMNMRHKKTTLTKSSEPGSNELKESSSDIKTTFIFKPVLPNPIAYAGIGIISDKGWSGIKEFFDGNEAGMCTLSVFNISAVKDHVKLNEDGLTYEVNDKPTRITVEGNINSGFMYALRWYDKNFAREIECANYDMNNSIKAKMIDYAKKVDTV